MVVATTVGSEHSSAIRNKDLNGIQVVRFGPGEFSSKLVSTNTVSTGSVVANIQNFTRGVQKRWSTVQISETEHIELDPESGLVFMVSSKGHTPVLAEYLAK